MEQTLTSNKYQFQINTNKYQCRSVSDTFVICNISNYLNIFLRGGVFSGH